MEAETCIDAFDLPGVSGYEDVQYDFDQVADEMRYYNECAGTRCDSRDDSATDVDSGYNSPRSIVMEQATNRPRRTVITSKTNSFDDKLICSKNTRLLDKRVQRNTSLQAIAWHLLDFISPRLGSENKHPKNYPMFQVADDRVHVHPSYESSMAGYCQRVPEMFVNVANSLLETNRQLEDLHNFAEQQRIIAEPPLFITAWLEFYDNFISTYLKELKRLQSTCFTPLTVLTNSTGLREQIALLHSIINPIKAAQMWKYEEMEIMWSLLLTAISDESLLSETQISVALQLQRTFYSILLNTMDHLFYAGQVSVSMKDHFVIYTEKNQAEFSMRKISRRSTIWSNKLVKLIIDGIVLRQRLPLGFHVSSSWFSDTFADVLGDWSGRVIPLYVFRSSFENVCQRLTTTLTREMFCLVVDAGVKQLWNDMKSITVGVAAGLFASSVFNLESMRHSQTEAFCNAIRLSGVSSIARWSRDVIPGYTGELKCEVSGILSHLVPNSLLVTLNRGLDSWMKLFRMHFLLVAILSERSEGYPSSLLRQYRFLTTKLFSIVETIRSHFHRMLSEVFDSAAILLEKVNSYYELEKILKIAAESINSLVDNSSDPTSKELWATVDRFSMLVDDIRLRSLSNAVTANAIDGWRRSMLFSCETLASLGRTSSPDNVFFSLYRQIQYR